MPVIVLTRQKADNQPLKQKLELAGFQVFEYPCIAIEPLLPADSEVETLRKLVAAAQQENRAFALFFSSKNAVEGFLNWLKQIDPTDPLSAFFSSGKFFTAAVGQTTASRLSSENWPVSLVASSAYATVLAREMLPLLAANSLVLKPEGNLARHEADEILTQNGHQLLSLSVYRHADWQPEPLSAGFDVILFASPSAVENFLQINPACFSSQQQMRVVAIGQTTASALQKHQIGCLQPASSQPDDVLAACLQALENSKS